MSDLASRLRAEAQALPPTADSGLARRVQARMPLAMPPRQSRTWLPTVLAAAALLVAASTVAWVALDRGTSPPAAPAAPVVQVLPTAPTLDEMLGQAKAGLPHTAVSGELDAIGVDLIALARTVRDAVPF